MAAYTGLSSADLMSIEALFGLPQITSVDVFAKGQENLNYHLQAGDQDYVLTVCESKTPAEAQVLIDTLRHLETHGFHTTRPVAPAEGTAPGIRGKPVLLKSYLVGTVVDPLPPEAMAPLGESMARLHRVPVPDFLPTELAYGRQTFAPMRSRFARPHPFLDWLESVDAYLVDNFASDLPRALIHSDVFADNVILTPEHGPVIMDFEEVANYFRVFDLGMAIVGTCQLDGVVNESAREALLAGYRSAATLTDAEEAAIDPATIYAAAAMASWRFWQFNVVQPDIGKQDHYRVLQQIAIDLLAR